jgi:hypothetical protein
VQPEATGGTGARTAGGEADAAIRVTAGR